MYTYIYTYVYICICIHAHRHRPTFPARRDDSSDLGFYGLELGKLPEHVVISNICFLMRRFSMNQPEHARIVQRLTDFPTAQCQIPGRR